jgi:DNA repair protein RecO (recombination protein O)
LHKRAYRETSLQLDVLTQDFGVISLIARGVTGAKKHILRTQLQALQHLKICYQLKSELAYLNQAELLSAPLMLSGERAMAGLYLNELVLKLCPRHDADPELFEFVLRTTQSLQHEQNLAWLVRRFERDLLIHLGYMAPWTFTAKGTSVDADAYYRIHAELGVIQATDNDNGAIRGQDIIDFSEDRLPSKLSMPLWRNIMHQVISQHIGNTQPRSWQMISDLTRQTVK